MAIKQTISLEGLQTVTSELKNLADVGESAFGRIRAAVEGGGGGLEAIATNILGIGNALTSLTGAVTIFTGITAALVGMTVSSSNAAEEFENLGIQLGTTIENSSALISSFARAGADVQGLAGQLRRAAVNITQEFKSIQESVREAGLKTAQNNLAVAQSLNGLAQASVKAAETEHNAALQREADSQSVLSAQNALDDLLEKRRVSQGGVPRDPQTQAEINDRRELQKIAEAQLKLDQAIQKQKEDLANAEAKASSEALAAEQAQLSLAKARQTALEDQKNSVAAAVTFVNALSDGVSTSGIQINRTVDNIFKGIVASAAGLDAAIAPIEGDISAIGSPTVFAVLLKTADALKNLTSETERTALASKLLGRRVGQEEVSFFAQGSAAILKHIEQVKKLGLEWTDADAKMALGFRVSLFTFEDTVARLKDKLGAVFAPVFGPFFDTLNKLLTDNKDIFVDWANTLKDTVKPTLDSIIRVLSGETKPDDKWLTDIIDTFKRFGQNIKEIVVPAFKSIIDIIGFVAKEINNLFGTNLDATSLIFIAWVTKILGGFKLIGIALELIGAGFVAFGAKAGIALLPLVALTAAVAAGFLIILAAVDKATFEGAKKLGADLIDLGKKIVDNFGKPAEESAANAEKSFGGLIDEADKLKTSGQAAGEGIVTGMGAAKTAVQGVTQEVAKLKTGIDATFRPAPAAGQSGFDLLPKAGPLIDLTKPPVPGVATGAQTPATQAAGVVDKQTLVQPFQDASDEIQKIWNSLTDFLSAIDFSQIFADVPDQMAAPFQDAEEAITNIFDAIATSAQQMAQKIVQAAQQAATAIQQVSFQGFGGSDIGAPFAAGGIVRGPGTWTSDSVHALLSRDEFVQPAFRVHQYGLDFMEAIRRGLLSTDAVKMLMGDFRGFNLGGLVTSSSQMPRFAVGGQVAGQASTRTLQLVLGGQSFTTTGPTKVIDALEREAALHSISSTGIAQSFVGRR